MDNFKDFQKTLKDSGALVERYQKELMAVSRTSGQPFFIKLSVISNGQGRSPTELGDNPIVENQDFLAYPIIIFLRHRGCHTFLRHRGCLLARHSPALALLPSKSHHHSILKRLQPRFVENQTIEEQRGGSACLACAVGAVQHAVAAGHERECRSR